MNEILQELLNRKSIRNFTGESVKDEDLKLIFEAAQRAPTSVNGQQVSIVYTKDKEKLKQISELCAGQEHIKNCEVFVMFVIDYNRTAYTLEKINQKQMIQESAEGIIVGSVDAGIMLSTLQAAARSLGYGTTAIGAVRLSVEKFIEILDLPKIHIHL